MSQEFTAGMELRGHRHPRQEENIDGPIMNRRGK
jgi:hypothetical protein